MKNKLLLLLALTFGLASNTWADIPKDKNNVYQIGTAAHLEEFATVVSSTANAKAVLTADITLTSPWTTPIGTSSKSYTGTFDGQGHKITGFSASSAGNGGLFGKVGSNATIKNFSIYGTLTVTANKYNGVISQALKSTISNVHSYLTITVTGGDHVGGVVGSTENGAGTTISGCSFNGSMSVSVTGNHAGIVGYASSDRIENCANHGSITYSAAACAAGGILGYLNNASCVITNCLNTGTVSYSGNDTPSYGGAIIGRHRATNSNITNNYWLSTSARQSSGTKVLVSPAATSLTAELLASGEFCYLLNGSVQGGATWHQNLTGTTDAYPTLDTSHEKVFEWDGDFYNAEDVPDLTISDEDDLKKFAAIVNGGANSVDAELDDDIDMTSIATTWVPIGDWNTGAVTSAYQGHFNGRGHEITNFIVSSNSSYYGLFGVISTGALIENFSISGTITNDKQYAGGVAAYARETPTIRNVHSSVNINNSHTSGRQGGILGGSMTGTVTIQNCSYTGTLDAGGNTGNYGGIVGYVNNSTAAYLNITNCLFDGKIQNGTTAEGQCGGIVGFCNSGYVTIKNCLSMGTIVSEAANIGQFFGRLSTANSKFEGNNFYTGDEICGTSSGASATGAAPEAVTAEQLASGEIAYRLNENKNAGTNWYQTLPASPSGDATPTLDSTHGLVYVNGTVCPDTGEPQGSVLYSNTEGTTVADHNYTGGEGFCIYCDFIQNDYITANAEGYYEIGTPAQLKWFAAYVNDNHLDSNAKLTSDISLSDIAWTPIGIGTGSGNPGATAYTGIFDGQGYSITGFEAEGSGHLGLFGDTDGATVTNFSISGNLTISGGYGGGVVAWPINSTISNVHSALTVSVPNVGVHHVGGVVGSARGNNIIDRCSFSGSLSITGSTDNFGGIVAYVTDNDKVQNCANYGSITFSAQGCSAGGILGYLNNYSVYVQNCLNTGTITCTGGSPTYGGAIVGRLRNHTAANVTNHYWLGTSAEGAGKNNDGNVNLTSAVEADATLLASGEVAYKLGAAWYQTIGTDDEPTLDSSHKQVILNGSYENVAATLSLNDAKSFGTNSNFDVTSVSMTRALKADKWNTFCIPFDMTSSEITSQLGTGTEVMALTGVTANGENYTMTFGTASSIEAGKPYMVKVKNAVSSFSLGDKTIKGTITPVTVKDASNNSLTFTGVFNNGYAPLNSFIISNNAFYLVDTAETVNLKAFRGYITTSSGSSVKAMNYVFEDTEDGISSLTPDPSPVGEGSIYNLAGQRIQKMQRGVNIVNGRKVLF